MRQMRGHSGSDGLREGRRALAIWAADWAEGVLARFEEERPGDGRVRAAILAARGWAEGRVMVSEARRAAFGAHDAARECTGAAACAAARASGHAAATAHVAGHARHAARYALKAVESLGK